MEDEPLTTDEAQAAAALDYRAAMLEISSGTSTSGLLGWGDNEHGQISVPEGTFTAVDAGLSHSLAIRTDGTLAGWGHNYQGQIFEARVWGRIEPGQPENQSNKPLPGTVYEYVDRL